VDAGESVVRTTLPAGVGALTAISCPSPAVCVAVDQSRSVLQSDGNTWLRFDTTGWLYDIECPDLEHCYVSASGLDSPLGGRAIAVSTDLGRTWAKEFGLAFPATNLQCFDALRCVFTETGDLPGGGSAPINDLLETTDEGSTWSRSGLPTLFRTGGGALGCGTPAWCILSAGRAASYESLGDVGRTWMAREIEAAAIRCPLEGVCFALGGDPGLGFITRLARPL
jgi:hypothetical protein